MFMYFQSVCSHNTPSQYAPVPLRDQCGSMPSPRVRGELRYRLINRYRISPPVAKLKTDLNNGIEFRHRHFFDILYYFAQIGGGEIRDRLRKRYRLSPPTLF